MSHEYLILMGQAVEADLRFCCPQIEFLGRVLVRTVGKTLTTQWKMHLSLLQVKLHV